MPTTLARGVVQQLGKGADAEMLVDRMRRRHPHRIVALSINARHGVGRAREARQEFAAADPFRQACTIILLEFRRCNVGYITIPARVCDADAPRHLCCVSFQARHRGHHPITHKRADAHRAVIRARHRMAYARINAPHRQFIGDGDSALQLGGLTEQREQPVRFAARGADDKVLDLLAEQGRLARINLHVECSGDCPHHGDFDGGGRADAFAFRHARINQQARAAIEAHAALSHQNEKRARRVSRPARLRLALKVIARGRVIQRLAVALKLRERHGE